MDVNSNKQLCIKYKLGTISPSFKNLKKEITVFELKKILENDYFDIPADDQKLRIIENKHHPFKEEVLQNDKLLSCYYQTNTNILKLRLTRIENKSDSNKPNNEEAIEKLNFEIEKQTIKRLLQENNDLRKDVKLLNETLAALPLRLETDMGVEDSRVAELKAQNSILAEKITAEEKKFEDEILQKQFIMESKDNELTELNKNLDEANYNILLLTDKLKNQDAKFSKKIYYLNGQLLEERGKAKCMKEQQDQLLIELNTLKEKWQVEARRIFNETIAYSQKSYKQMLAIEGLGFLKPNEDSSFVRPSMNPAESMQSVMTASSSFERVDGDFSGSQFLDTLDEAKEKVDSNK